MHFFTIIRSFEEAVSATCWVNVSGISNNTVDIDSASSALETPVNPSLSQSNPTSYPLLALGTTVGMFSIRDIYHFIIPSFGCVCIMACVGWVKMYDPRVNRSSGDASSPEFSVVAHMSTRPRKVQVSYSPTKILLYVPYLFYIPTNFLIF